MSQSAPILSPLGQAALSYARRGWPVFPCRERDDRIVKGNGDTMTLKAKAPYVGSGVKDATRDEEVIKGWWRRWPDAMIGLAMGHNGLFALDFDPRIDEDSGEVFTLDTLKAALVEQMGCELPKSLSAMTQSDGVHVYLRQPTDGGEPIRNRGNLPRHVDVRGLGGYVIAPPSILYREDGTEGRYSWLSNRHDDPVEAPAALIEILRSKGKKAAAGRPAQTGKISAESAPEAVRRADVNQAEYEAIRKYSLSGLDAECQRIRSAPSGSRNTQLNESALKVASLTVAKPFATLDARFARSAIEAAARDNPGDDDERQLLATIASGWTAGEDTPRDLTDIATRARQRAERPHRSSSSASPRSPASEKNGEPSSHAGGNGDKGPKKGAQGVSEADQALNCAGMAMTDLGNLERFLARHGRDFLYVEAWGWLAWDGKRWNRDMAMALLGWRIQQTMRSIQDEADAIRQSGVPFPPEQGDLVDDDDADELKAEREEEKDDYTRQLFDEGEKKRLNRRSLLWYRQRQLARQTKHDGPRHDYIVQIKSNGDIVLFSDKLAAWGRTSEGAGHISCIDSMAEARLSARVEDFDSDPLALNVQNGTILFARPENGNLASFRIREHLRDDRITKIARATYNAAATSPLFGAFIERVQPAEDMREFLDRWAGYSGLGLADAQKMALFFGEGQNGKGVWVQTHAHLLGDYSWSTGIETFMDADTKRNGGGPSPHLAALAGRRMVYANEPEDGSKFSDGLVKALTSDEPIGGVRELLKPPFEMTPTFNNTIMANNLPRIGTDHGIRRRMQVIPWGIIIPPEERDEQLKNKLKAEADGILNRLIRGALAYLNEGLNMPEASAEATRDYHEENDMLAMFLDLCIARSPGDKMQSGALHALFVAWQTWAQQLPANGKAWSAKYLNAQMQRKGFKINKASTMQWHDIVPRFDTIDFLDVDGKPTTRALPTPRHTDKPSAGKPPRGDAAPPAPPSPPHGGGFEEDDLPP